ncbi:MAG: response regulator [Thaumarchaeota archaeon]|nr:response regulator [Nitrososphaerota archaeon]
MITCIVVDDDVNTVKVFSDILELMGLHVVGRGFSGSEAVCLYKTYAPDVIFIDLMMPKTDGFYAIKKIQQINSNAKIVVITADLSLETYQKLDELKIKAIIYKPFGIHNIKKVLEQYNINTSS